MAKGPLIVAIIFIVLGALGILLSTALFTNWSETALIGAAFAFLSTAAALFGVKLGDPSTGKAVGFGILFGFLMNLTLVIFFNVIWPML